MFIIHLECLLPSIDSWQNTVQIKRIHRMRYSHIQFNDTLSKQNKLY